MHLRRTATGCGNTLRLARRLAKACLGVLFGATLLSAAPAFASDAGSAAGAAQDVAPGEVIVVYEKAQNTLGAMSTQQAESTVEESVERATSFEVEDVEVLASQLGDYGTAVQVTLEDGASVESAVDELSQMDGVAFAQPNFHYGLLEDVSGEAMAEAEGESLQGISALATANDPFKKQQYYLNAWDETFTSYCGANVETAWETASCNGGVTVAILDTGCNVNHVDLKDNLLSSLAYNAVDKSTDVEDTIGHGTHCAGLAGAVANNAVGMAGSSYNAKILPIKVFSGEECYTTWLIYAYVYLDKLIEDGTLADLHVVNMSLGGYDTYSSQDKLLESAIAHMRTNHNVITVCAGGNGDESGKAYVDTPMYPGDYDECLCVTALNRNGTNCAWSDYNQYKDISAPGYALLSTVPDSYTSNVYASGTDATYAYMSGTSMASPLVAGICALLWAVDPGLTVDTAVTAIESTAHAVNPAANDWGDKTGSAGAIDAAAAVKYVADNIDPSIVNLSQAKIELDQDCFAATGSACCPKVTVTCNGEELKEGTHYKVSYSNNVNVGTATVFVYALSGSGYGGSVSTTFRICNDLSKGRIGAIQDQHYAGSAVEPSVAVYDSDDKLLTYGVDYSLSYQNNNAPGTAQVVATGTGEYTGSLQAAFTILDDASALRQAIASAQQAMDGVVSVGAASQVPTEGSWVPSAAYSALEEALESCNAVVNVYDTTGSYDSKAAESALAALEKAQAAFETSKHAGVESISISDAAVEGMLATYEYTGQAINPKPQLTWEGVALVEGVDYTLSYTGDCTNNGSYQVVVAGTGRCSGELCISFAIAGQGIGGAQMGTRSFTYDGTAKRPGVRIEGLVEGVDYTVAYPADCVSAGAKAITVTGMGDWTGSQTLFYTVAKATPSVKIGTSKLTVKASKLKKKARTLTALKASGTKGTKTFTKVSGSKKLSISKAGKIKVKKGTKKGTYKIRVKLTSAATANWNAASATKTIKVAVK